MKLYIFKILSFISIMIFCTERGLSQDEVLIVKVDDKKINVDGKYCYLLTEIVQGKDTIRNMPFCGDFENFNYKEGSVWNLSVNKNDFKEDTINVISAREGDFMKVAKKKILVDDQLCYSVRKGYSRKDKSPWVPYCGVIDNFSFDEGYEYTMHVKKFDPSADTIYVVKVIGRESDKIPCRYPGTVKKRIPAKKSEQK